MDVVLDHSNNDIMGNFVSVYCFSGKYFVCIASLQKHGKIPSSVFLFNFNFTLMNLYAKVGSVATPSKGWIAKQIHGIRCLV